MRAARSLIVVLLLSGGIVSATTPASQAATAIVDDQGASPVEHANFDVAGWRFQAASPLSVTSLGLFADGGLEENHEVTIFDEDGNVVVTVTVASGSAIDGQGYSYALISPTVLVQGDYFIGAHYLKDSPDFMRDGVVAPPVTPCPVRSSLENPVAKTRTSYPPGGRLAIE